MKTKEEKAIYEKKWREGNKDRVKATTKRYYHENKEKILKNNREQLKGYWQDRYNKRRAMLDGIKLNTGCQNPYCEWKGKFLACDLDFHHLNDDKEKSIAQMVSHGLIKLVREINRCVVLCAICHRRATYRKLDCSKYCPCEINIEDLIQEVAR